MDIHGPVRPQVFVESAVKRGKEDKDNYLVQYVRGVFKHLASSAKQFTHSKLFDLDMLQPAGLVMAFGPGGYYGDCTW